MLFKTSYYRMITFAIGLFNMIPSPPPHPTPPTQKSRIKKSDKGRRKIRRKKRDEAAAERTKIGV
jgi:hypothetical protein